MTHSDKKQVLGRRCFVRWLASAAAVGLALTTLGCRPAPDPAQPLPPDRLPARPNGK